MKTITYNLLEKSNNYPQRDVVKIKNRYQIIN